jgi:organic radical activating enzyme
MRVRYSEIFFSFQGEAELAGVPAVWLRFFGCNLNCSGFGQKDPTDPSTYVLPFENFDLTNIKRVEDLPVWQFGCDSSYSWSAKYKHLAHDVDISQLVDRLTDINRSQHNPDGLFTHPVTHQPTMMCFTGGEPMLQQSAIIETLREFYRRGNMPQIVTIETNATKPISLALKEFITHEFSRLGGVRWHWAMSPKLFTVSGEADVVDPSVIVEYVKTINSTAVLKFVCNGTDKNWDELENHVAKIRRALGITQLPAVWVMPVGARQEEQTPTFLGPICIDAMRRGYNVATRNQVAVFGNIIGS